MTFTLSTSSEKESPPFYGQETDGQSQKRWTASQPARHRDRVTKWHPQKVCIHHNDCVQQFTTPRQKTLPIIGPMHAKLVQDDSKVLGLRMYVRTCMYVCTYAAHAITQGEIVLCPTVLPSRHWSMYSSHTTMNAADSVGTNAPLVVVVLQ